MCKSLKYNEVYDPYHTYRYVEMFKRGAYVLASAAAVTTDSSRPTGQCGTLPKPVCLSIPCMTAIHNSMRSGQHCDDFQCLCETWLVVNAVASDSRSSAADSTIVASTQHALRKRIAYQRCGRQAYIESVRTVCRWARETLLPQPLPQRLVATMDLSLLSLPHHLLTEILHKAGTSGAAAACCCTSLLHAWALVLSDPAHATALLLQRYGSGNEALKHLYAYGLCKPGRFFDDRLIGRRTAFGALNSILETLSHLPRDSTAPISQETSFAVFLTAPNSEGDNRVPGELSIPQQRQEQQQQHQHQKQQQQTPFRLEDAGTVAEDLYAEAVVRALVAQGEGFDGYGKAGEAVGRGAAMAGHERVVVFLLSQGMDPSFPMHGANLSGHVRLCTALLASMRPYMRICTARDGGLLRAGQGTAAAQQQAAAVVAGGGEGRLSSVLERRTEGWCKHAALMCLNTVCTFAPATPHPRVGQVCGQGHNPSGRADGHGPECSSSGDGEGGHSARYCSGVEGDEGRDIQPEGGRLDVDGRGRAGGCVSGAPATGVTQTGRSSRSSSSFVNSNGGIPFGCLDSGSSSSIDRDGASLDVILPVVAAAKAAAEAAAAAALSAVLQRSPGEAREGVRSAPLAAAVAAALQVQSQHQLCAAAAAARGPQSDECAASATPRPTSSPRGPLSPAPSPASRSPPWPHHPPSPSSCPVDDSGRPSSNGSPSNRNPCDEPRPLPQALKRPPSCWRHRATANHRYLTLARSLIHAWGADLRSKGSEALARAVWSGSRPLVLELLRAGAAPRDIRHGREAIASAAVLGRWDIVEGMYGRGDARTALFLVALKGLLLLYSAAVHVGFRLRLVRQRVWVLAALGRLRVVRWAVVVAEKAWVGLWHVLWWWMWG